MQKLLVVQSLRNLVFLFCLLPLLAAFSLAQVPRSNHVWLVTEEGRLQAAVHGIDKLADELAGGEFLRVHRRFIVNLSSVRAVDRGARGELSLIMDGTSVVGPASCRPALGRPASGRALTIVFSLAA